MVNQNWIKTRSGVEMPGIIYGTAWKKDQTAEFVELAIKSGFRGIDTAGQPKHYDEHLVGEALSNLKMAGIERKDLYLQTKFTPPSGQDLNNIPYDKNAPIEIQVAQSFENSQKNLKTDYVDTLILHSPVFPLALLLKVWKAMEEIQVSGNAKQLGISNCYDIEVFNFLYSQATVKPAVLQNRFYQATGYDQALRQFCRDHEIVYQSFWTLTANPHLLSGKTIRNIAQHYNKTEEQVLFRYLSQSGVVPLTGTTSERHMKDDLAIFDFRLSEEELVSISRLINRT